MGRQEAACHPLMAPPVGTPEQGPELRRTRSLVLRAKSEGVDRQGPAVNRSAHRPASSSPARGEALSLSRRRSFTVAPREPVEQSFEPRHALAQIGYVAMQIPKEGDDGDGGRDDGDEFG